MYLFYSPEDFRAGRLPNRLYRVATADHFESNFVLAARTFLRVVNSGHDSNRDNQSAIDLGLRGLIEWAKHHKTTNTLDQLLEDEELRKVIESTKEYGIDEALLQFELEGVLPTSDGEGGELDGPGFSAAVGWALNNLFRGEEDADIRSHTKEWFFLRLEHMSDLYGKSGKREAL